MLRGNESTATLSVRDHFAALAMQGLLADPETRADSGPAEVADLAVAHADALIARLNGATNGATPSRLLERPGEDGQPY